MAISKQDLRIGNLVRKPAGCGEYNIVVVEDIQEDCINQHDIAAYGCPPSNWFKTEGCIEGIPLSEEWLIKFGFEIINDAVFYKKIAIKEGIHLHWDEECWHMTINYNREVKFVHDLQNYFYIITGTELELQK